MGALPCLADCLPEKLNPINKPSGRHNNAIPNALFEILSCSLMSGIRAYSAPMVPPLITKAVVIAMRAREKRLISPLLLLIHG